MNSNLTLLDVVCCLYAPHVYSLHAPDLLLYKYQLEHPPAQKWIEPSYRNKLPQIVKANILNREKDLETERTKNIIFFGDVDD